MQTVHVIIRQAVTGEELKALLHPLPPARLRNCWKDSISREHLPEQSGRKRLMPHSRK